MKTRLPLLLASLPLLLLSCTKNEAPAPTPPEDPNVVTVNNVSYTNFTKDLLKTNCSGCHGGTGGASRAWKYEDTYDNAKTNGSRLNDAVQSGRMPIGRTLTQQQKDLLKAWITRNMPQ